jgi:hypothetical protein
VGPAVCSVLVAVVKQFWFAGVPKSGAGASVVASYDCQYTHAESLGVVSSAARRPYVRVSPWSSRALVA